MSTAKKLEFIEMPEGYMPNFLPDIIKLAKNAIESKGIIHQRKEVPYLFETNRLIIRRFLEEDGENLCTLAKDKEVSPLANCDHKWPTDLESCIGIADFFSKNEAFWAVCIKPNFELIGMITFNSIDENNMVDLGHIWRMAFMKEDLDTEAISLMVQYAFEKLLVVGVYANNPLHYEEQIRPLKQIGFEITETNTGSLVNDEEGKPITFTGCKMIITKSKWESLN